MKTGNLQSEDSIHNTGLARYVDSEDREVYAGKVLDIVEEDKGFRFGISRFLGEDLLYIYVREEHPRATYVCLGDIIFFKVGSNVEDFDVDSDEGFFDEFKICTTNRQKIYVESTPDTVVDLEDSPFDNTCKKPSCTSPLEILNQAGSLLISLVIANCPKGQDRELALNGIDEAMDSIRYSIKNQ